MCGGEQDELSLHFELILAHEKLFEQQPMLLDKGDAEVRVVTQLFELGQLGDVLNQQI